MRYHISIAPVILAIAAISVNAGDGPTPNQLIDCALRAGGGIEKIRQFKAVAFKADFKMGATKAKVSGTFAHPTLFHVTIDSEETGNILMVGGGNIIWTKKAKEATSELRLGDETAIAELQFLYAIGLPDMLASLKGKDYKLTLTGDQAVNGVKAAAVRVEHKQFPETTIYFDKETGLPVKTQIKAASMDILEVFFEDYKEFDGVKHYTKFKVHAAGETFQCEVREIRLLKSVDSKLFKSP